jgi:2-polyprenyl-3-methyl-5-hydroxy-6-metoxy-1,4-benzoquinol methylase
MSKTPTAVEHEALSSTYDSRYRGDYRARLSGYEISRHRALGHFLRSHLDADGVKRILDYGAGRGLFIPLWRELFPGATIAASDISAVALESLRAERGPEHPTIHMNDGHLPADHAGEFDLVVSVEVLEHVANLDTTLRDIHACLRPGGLFVWTTPCANVGSIEHIFAAATGRIRRSETGERRWSWEDPTHLRRLTTKEAAAAWCAVGFEAPVFRLRAHLFSFLVTYSPLRRLPGGFASRLMDLDYLLFRRFPNGASMIGMARKSG